MTAFHPVNAALPESHPHIREGATPTTPRPNTAPSAQPASMHRDDATTPTRANFGSLASQRPLPTSPFPPALTIPEAHQSPKKPVRRGDSQYSTRSRKSEDVEMGGDSEGEEHGSENESVVNADETKTSTKKKSQKFYCTAFPPCFLNFTRSEHLARHIRKHTGERPFQCHCSRRFSRLDNLRQHAQTVHMNEEIPQDSLAATGTRFQRQVRTDKARPAGSRSRASTTSSQVSQGRGHTRNSLSASSIGSGSSAYSARDDPRRRPPPLVMAGEPGGRFFHEMTGPYHHYRPHSPGHLSSPASATFSTGPNSPWGASGIQSPISAHPRHVGIYADHRTPGRRLSVPSTGNPFQSPNMNSYGPSVLTPLNSSNMGSFSPSSGMMTSPTSSTSGSVWSRRESIFNATDDAWRRRTWHPDTNTGFTSRLHVVTTPSYYSSGPPPQPQSVLPSNAPPRPPMRLPGIESFDPLPPRPTTPARRQPSPMFLDPPCRAPPPGTEAYPNGGHSRPNSQHWDQGIHRNMNRLDLAQGTPPGDAASSWASEANRAVQAQAEQAQVQPPPSGPFEGSSYSAGAPASASWRGHQHTISAPPITPKGSKRHGWYHGPVATAPNRGLAQRTSPADSSGSEGGVPGTSNPPPLAETNPGIVHTNGWVENRNGASHAQFPRHDPRIGPSNGHPLMPRPNGPGGTDAFGSRSQQAPAQPPQHHVPRSTDNDMRRLAALVAVATSEVNATTSIC